MQKQIPETKNASVKLECTKKCYHECTIYVIVIVKFRLLHTNAGNIHTRMLRPIVDLLLHKAHLLLAAAPCPARGRTKTNSNYDHDGRDDSDDNIDDRGGGEGQRYLAMLDFQ